MSRSAPAHPTPDSWPVARRDLQLSLALLAIVVVLALAGLAGEGDWPKILRVGLAFLTYGGALLLWLRVRPGSRAGRSIPFHWFATAGAAAGVVSGLVRPQIEVSVLLANTLGAAFLVGGVHWAALAHWRGVRDAVTARTVTERREHASTDDARRP